MSQTQQTTPEIGSLQRQADPLAGLDPSEEVLRCDDPQTGWRWFFDVRADGRIERYHEYHDFEREVIPPERAAETARLERVDSVSVSRVHLDILTGETDG